jgi:hypothetical protein
MLIACTLMIGLSSVGANERRSISHGKEKSEEEKHQQSQAA